MGRSKEADERALAQEECHLSVQCTQKFVSIFGGHTMLQRGTKTDSGGGLGVHD